MVFNVENWQLDKYIEKWPIHLLYFISNKVKKQINISNIPFRLVFLSCFFVWII